MDSGKYFLIDSGGQQKLEQFGSYTLVRPCSQALWKPTLSSVEWQRRSHAQFSRDVKKNGWTGGLESKSWVVELESLRFKISPTDFGHVGIFPEHSQLWSPLQSLVRQRSNPHILNAFAYSGGATLAMAQAGAKVCHLDASKGMVAWARENAALNGLSSAPIRWIVDDACKFLQREINRGVFYDGIILDPPSFGRGNRGEVFKIEEDIHPLLSLCVKLLSKNPLFLVFTTHTPGMTPIVMGHLLEQYTEDLPGGSIETGEMVLPSSIGRSIPSGSYARWHAHAM